MVFGLVVGVLLAVLVGCASGGGRPKPPVPPTPIPPIVCPPGTVLENGVCVAVPPTPAPWMPPPALSKLNCKEVGVSRVVIDCTPKTCPDRPDPRDWCRVHSTGGVCCEGGPEGSDQRPQAEAIWGPYAWTIDGTDCLASGACFLDGGNPLRVVAPRTQGKVIRCTGGNGVFGEVVP